MTARPFRSVLLLAAVAAAAAACGGNPNGADRAAPDAGMAPMTGSTASPVVTGAPPGAATPPPRAASDRRPTATPTPTRETRPPAIGGISTTPRLACDAAWCALPAGAGAVMIAAKVRRADAVEFFLVPTGTGTWDERTLLGRDTDGSDGWTARWNYADAPLTAHLVIVASGPGGTTEVQPFNVYHPDPPRS